MGERTSKISQIAKVDSAIKSVPPPDPFPDVQKADPYDHVDIDDPFIEDMPTPPQQTHKEDENPPKKMIIPANPQR
jgi:hypothetical protein